VAAAGRQALPVAAKAKSSDGKRLASLEGQIAQLKADAAKREAKLAALQQGQMAVDDEAEASADSAAVRIKFCRSFLADIHKLDPEKAAVAGVAAAREQIAQELQGLLVSQREGKPLDQRAKELERVIESAKRQHAKAKDKAADLQAQLLQLQESVAAASAAEGEALAKLSKLEAEQADVLRRRAAEVERVPALPAAAPVAPGPEAPAVGALLAMLAALKADDKLDKDVGVQLELVQAALAPQAAVSLPPPADGQERGQQVLPLHGGAGAGWDSVMGADSDEAAFTLVVAARKRHRGGPYAAA
jgi:hypothetical protein